MIAPSSRRRARSKSRASDGPVRVAVVGLGYIAQVAVLPAFRNARKHCQLAALISSDPTKLRSLGRKYGVDQLIDYDEYDDLMRSGLIDAVYIALPNSMHAEYTIRAANAGVHVLCEKPMAVTEDECLRMIAACRQNDVKLMIAYRLHFEEANMKAVEIAQSGALGELRLFDSVFSMPVKQGNIRLEPQLGGGTLYDIGIYCINASRYIFRAEPVEVVAFTTHRPDDARFNEVDESTAAILRFPGHRSATFLSSFNASDVGYYHVVGSTGDLRVAPAYEFAGPLEHELTVNGKSRRKTFSQRDQFAPLLMHFAECIRTGNEPEPSGDEGLIDVRIIQALYHSAAIGQPVRLNLFPPDQRPAVDRHIKRPAVREPRLVHAEAPTIGD